MELIAINVYTCICLSLFSLGIEMLVLVVGVIRVIGMVVIETAAIAWSSSKHKLHHRFGLRDILATSRTGRGIPSSPSSLLHLLLRFL